MKTLRLGFFSLLALLLFSNCEQEQALTGTIIEPSEEQIAQNYLMRASHLVLFVALEVDHESYGMKGYLIDKHANLRTIDVKNGIYHKFENEYMSDDVMRKLYDKSEAVEKLDPIILADMLKKSYRLVEGELAAVNNGEIKTSKVYFSFERNNNHEPEGSCGPGSYDHGPTFLQTLIAANGRLNGQNSDEEVTDLLNWLKSLEGEDIERQGK
ncbi:MAG: hypothetical protein AAF806_23425 [Bacteroidota bacterium]